MIARNVALFCRATRVTTIALAIESMSDWDIPFRRTCRHQEFAGDLTSVQRIDRDKVQHTPVHADKHKVEEQDCNAP